jgi:ribulose-phosphate 3-epimerase
MTRRKTTMEKLLCPSMMCANYGNLEKEIHTLEEAGIDIFHVDIMDGQFVPNFAMGIQDVEYLCKTATAPIDAHLMIEEPKDYVKQFAELGINIIYIHPETDAHAVRTLQTIDSYGVKPGIGINPGTAVETITPLLPFIKYVLVMSVNPGFAGQQYIPSVEGKIDKLLNLRSEFGFDIVIDGACTPERIAKFNKKGVKGFVLGTSALFGKNRSYRDIIQELRTL